MSLQQRKRNVNITDQENIKPTGKLAHIPKPTEVRRPALRDVGNKMQSGELRKSVRIKAPAFTEFSVPAVPKKNPVTKGKSTTVTSKSKTEAIAKVNENSHKTMKLIKPHISRVFRVNKLVVEEPSSYSSQQLVGVIDVDANDQSDPFLVSEYIQDICSYLHSLERKYTIRENFMENHRLNPKMRSILVDWMVNMHTDLKFLLETLHLSVGLLDRYLQINKNIGRDTLQLVGVTAIIIAGKYEEIYVPDISEFAYICDYSYTQSEILKMEADMLSKLNFNLGRPLSVHFLRRYSKIAAVKPEHHNLAKYLLEICLLEYELCHIDPSIQAASACCLSMSILNKVSDPAQVWSQTLVRYTNYKYSDIKIVVRNLAYFLAKMKTSKFQTIWKKYSAFELNKVSVLPELNCALVKGYA